MKKNKVKPYLQRIPKYGAVRKEPTEPEPVVSVAPVKNKKPNWDIMHTLGDKYFPEKRE